jgi:UPF0716 protein FxsA
MAQFIRYGLFALPFVELVLLILVGDWIGGLETLGLLVVAALIGVVVLRVLGRASLGDLADAFRRGESPIQDMARGLCVVLAGFLLIVPGFITDGIAIVLLVRPLQHRLASAIFGRRPVPSQPAPPAGGVVIDVEPEPVPPRLPDGRSNPWGDHTR